MKRRDFLKTSVVAGAALSIDFTGLQAALSSNTMAVEQAPEMVAVMGGEPEVMLDKALETLGGIGKYIKKGQKVVIKPNIGWDRPPESGANTNPELVGRMVSRCLEAGAKEVSVFDHTCDNWVASYSKSGIRAAVEAAGGKMVSGAVEEDYREVDIPGAVNMKKAKVHRLILDSDVFFNVPVLKHHGGAKLTCAMKNFMGLVWDRRHMHANNLQQCIADASLIRRPDLNVVDAFRVMTTGGPRGNANSVVRNLRSLLLSRDIVAVDTASARMIDFPLSTIGHIPAGQKLGLGTTELGKLDIRRVVL